MTPVLRCVNKNRQLSCVWVMRVPADATEAEKKQAQMKMDAVTLRKVPKPVYKKKTTPQLGLF